MRERERERELMYLCKVVIYDVTRFPCDSTDLQGSLSSSDFFNHVCL